MADFKAELLGGTDVVTEFEIDSFDGLRVKSFDSYSEEWAHFVFEHRTEPHGNTLHDFDVVYGPISNDRIGAQITRFKLFKKLCIPESGLYFQSSRYVYSYLRDELDDMTSCYFSSDSMGSS